MRVDIGKDWERGINQIIHTNQFHGYTVLKDGNTYYVNVLTEKSFFREVEFNIASGIYTVAGGKRE